MNTLAAIASAGNAARIQLRLYTSKGPKQHTALYTRFRSLNSWVKHLGLEPRRVRLLVLAVLWRPRSVFLVANHFVLAIYGTRLPLRL
jgi:hypothetical protein